MPPRLQDKSKSKKNIKLKEQRIKEYLAGDDWKKNHQKTKKEIEGLIYCNPQLDKFITLTFAQNLKDVNVANNYFHNFIGRFRRPYPEFQYICVPERQKRGAIHYHLLCSIPYVPSKKLEEIWSYGFIKIKRIDRVKNLAKYMTKYLTKGIFDGSLFGKKKFFCSEELNRPVLLRDENALDMILKTNDLEVLYKNEFPAPYVGSIKYIFYRKQNKP